ncbi:MAG: hypothetical protein JSR48_10125 [Verrucomicrobia bacterium]|nr:hypothetical protein [Verrucomicrobiota bacterium]
MPQALKPLAVREPHEQTPQQAEAARCIMCDCIILFAFAALLVGALVALF